MIGTSRFRKKYGEVAASGAESLRSITFCTNTAESSIDGERLLCDMTDSLNSCGIDMYECVGLKDTSCRAVRCHDVQRALINSPKCLYHEIPTYGQSHG